MAPCFFVVYIKFPLTIMVIRCIVDIVIRR
nr:MAG TPA: hypothetical protein [Caudoviricetes sp.]